jgi:death-on-curing protein
MISAEVVTHLHKILINKYGGIHGVRDYNALGSAINRPFMTFDQNELYLTPIDKAAALIESLICNHPFIDGNKRIGYVLMKYFLLENDLDIKATQSEKFDFVIKIAQGQLSFEQIRCWLSEKAIKN